MGSVSADPEGENAAGNAAVVVEFIRPNIEEAGSTVVVKRKAIVVVV